MSTPILVAALRSDHEAERRAAVELAGSLRATSALGELRRLAARLAAADDPGTWYERSMLDAVLDALTTERQAPELGDLTADKALEQLNGTAGYPGADGTTYLERALPDPVDELAGTLVAAWVAANQPERRRLEGAMHVRAAQVLEGYAERMASHAVVADQPSALGAALAALALAAKRDDEKEVLLVVPLVHRSAERLGLDPATVFAAGLDPVAPDAPEWLSAFPQRAPQERSVTVMGYVEERQPNGLLYRRAW